MLSSVLHFNSGVFHFHEELPTQSYISSITDISASTFATDDRKSSKLTKSNARIVKGNKVCLLNVPSFMIPCEILRYFTKPYLDSILSMQILRHTGDNDDKYLVYLELDCESSAKSLIRDFDGQPLSTLEQISCVLYSIRSVHLSTADDGNSETDYQYKETDDTSESLSVGTTSCTGIASTSARFLSSSPSSSTSSFMLRTRALSLSSFPSTLATTSPTISRKLQPLTASKAKAQIENSALHISNPEDLDAAAPAEEGLCVEENFCPVCLEVINGTNPHSFTTACHHTYHIDCISKLEGPQCPVCRCERAVAVRPF